MSNSTDPVQSEFEYSIENALPNRSDDVYHPRNMNYLNKRLARSATEGADLENKNIVFHAELNPVNNIVNVNKEFVVINSELTESGDVSPENVTSKLNETNNANEHYNPILKQDNGIKLEENISDTSECANETEDSYSYVISESQSEIISDKPPTKIEEIHALFHQENAEVPALVERELLKQPPLRVPHVHTNYYNKQVLPEEPQQHHGGNANQNNQPYHYGGIGPHYFVQHQRIEMPIGGYDPIVSSYEQQQRASLRTTQRPSIQYSYPHDHLSFAEYNANFNDINAYHGGHGRGNGHNYHYDGKMLRHLNTNFANEQQNPEWGYNNGAESSTNPEWGYNNGAESSTNPEWGYNNGAESSTNVPLMEVPILTPKKFSSMEHSYRIY